MYAAIFVNIILCVAMSTAFPVSLHHPLCVFIYVYRQAGCWEKEGQGQRDVMEPPAETEVLKLCWETTTSW